MMMSMMLKLQMVIMMIIFKSYDDEYDGTATHHTVGHDGDDDDPFKGRPRDKPDKESPEEKILLVFAYSSSL